MNHPRPWQTAVPGRGQVPMRAPVANAAGITLISRRESAVDLYVVATDEELMIGRHTLALTLDRNRPRHQAA